MVSKNIPLSFNPLSPPHQQQVIKDWAGLLRNIGLEGKGDAITIHMRKKEK